MSADRPQERSSGGRKPARGGTGRRGDPADGTAPEKNPAKLRKVAAADHVSWRRTAVLFSVFVILLVLIGLTGSRATSSISRWVGRSVFFRSGGSGWGVHPNAEVSDLAFEDGWAELGQFNVKVFEPASRRRFRAEFKLEGAIDCKDEASFQDFMQRNHRFFREQVTIAIRTSPTADLNDPEHRILRKRILARVNRALGRPFLTSVELPGFTLYESIAESGLQRVQPEAGAAP
ncbi:MAG: hypothetical protein JW809_00805 [Pirellulales bacterium]|nr:hypothetical protein [Pirellulales bacterium]